MVDNLDDIVGQDTAKRFIRTAIKKGNLYNFLFLGPRGVGKRFTGFRIARLLGCTPQSPNFTLIAPIPSKIRDKMDRVSDYLKKYLPDNPTVELEDRSSILIEQIRTLIKGLMHMPLKDTKRVVLILEADRMTDEAANCFLKTLEEPPLDTLFILTSSRPHRVIPTIRSRCRTVPFSYVKANHIKDILFEGKDSYILGSPGEILMLQECDVVEEAFELFRQCPLDTPAAAKKAKAYERKTAVDLLYPLVLLYRLVMYKKLYPKMHVVNESTVTRKAKSISIDTLIKTLAMLNQSINDLEQNPNRLLFFFNIFQRLP